MSAQNFAVNFPYGAQDGTYYGPNGSVGPFHRGNDRPCPVGTELVIAGVLVGKTGATGLVGGPHLHTQAGSDLACQLTFDPSPLEFKPGVVVALQTVDKGQWGKYITLRVGTKFITYAHLSEVRVTINQVIGGKMRQLIPANIVREHYINYTGVDPGTDSPALQNRFEDPIDDEFWYGLVSMLNSIRQARDKQIADLQVALTNEQAKPNREVIKEVIKIVEKPVEVRVEVPVPAPVDPDSVVITKNSLWDWFKRIFK